jgi:hypothetical protein
MMSRCQRTIVSGVTSSRNPWRRPRLAAVRRFKEAITAHQDAAAIYREAGAQRREGMTLNNLGLAQREVRRFD